jgi:tripartite-type tricarboxylate transporter receptor subunit TctC
MSSITRLFFSVAVTAVAASTGKAAMAQNYPDKPITLVVGQSPGGGTDILARLFAEKLGSRLGKQVVVKNLPGAGGNIGAELVARSGPDGYTLLMMSAPHAIAQSLYTHLAYNLKRDFVPVGMVAQQQLCLVVYPSLPARNYAEFLAYLKAQPGKVFYASAGNGSFNHLATELFKSMAGVNMVHVPYKGSGPSMTDVMSGRVPVTFGNILPILPLVQAGKVRPLAVTGLSRTPALPNVPTLDESGLKGYEAINWYGIAAPAGTSPEIVKRLNTELAGIVKQPDIEKLYATLGAEAFTTTPEQAKTFVDKEIVKWAKAVKLSGATVD